MPISALMKLWYRKPEWRDLNDYIRQLNEERRSPSPHSERRLEPKASRSSLSSIPSKLALDRVLENKTCSPMSLHDFYMYLRYIEYSSENLEFLLWYKQYDANYPDDLREDDTTLDVDLRTAHLSEYSEVMSVTEIIQTENTKSVRSITDTLSSVESPCAHTARVDSTWSTIFRWSMASSRNRDSTIKGNGCKLNVNEDLERATSAISSPLFAELARPKENRAELDAAIATYLRPGAEKELNISHGLRQRTLLRLRESSDPRHLKPVADHIYELMKNCSHRNFVSLGLQTGTYETICVGNLIALSSLIGGFLLVLLRALYPHVGSHSRWNVFYSLPLWWFGTIVMLLGTQGMCSLMLSLSKRQPLPWERIEEEKAQNNAGGSEKNGPRASMDRWRRCRTFMRRTVLGDRHVRVEDKNLRKVQIMIFAQCIAYGCLAAICCVMIFLFLPIWKETAPNKRVQSLR